MEFSKRIKLKGNTPKIIKLKIELPSVLINEGGNSEDILNIQELVDEDFDKALNDNSKNFSILEEKRPSKDFLNLQSAKGGYNEVT